MEKWLDLHMHSVYSNDGEFAPEELMKKCAAAGLRAVALADHNSVRGVPAARGAARRLKLKFLSALEIDCIHEGRNFHLLGYGIREKAPAFTEIERQVHVQELAASEKLIALVRKLGFFFDEKTVWDKAVNGVVVAEMIAEAVLADKRNDSNRLLAPLRAGGARSDNPLVNFYWDFCSQGKPAYVAMTFISLTAAVQIIRENGGAAVLAHPGANIGRNREVAESVIKAGIDGIEAYSNYHDAETRSFYAELCAEHRLIASPGSDFHGKSKLAIHLGELGHPSPQAICEQLGRLIENRGGEVLG